MGVRDPPSIGDQWTILTSCSQTTYPIDVYHMVRILLQPHWLRWPCLESSVDHLLSIIRFYYWRTLYYGSTNSDLIANFWRKIRFNVTLILRKCLRTEVYEKMRWKRMKQEQCFRIVTGRSICLSLTYFEPTKIRADTLRTYEFSSRKI